MSATFPTTGLVLLLFDQSGTMAQKECIECDSTGVVSRDILDQTAKRYGVRQKRARETECGVCKGRGTEKNTDALDAFFSSLRKLREKQHKGQTYRDNFKIGVAIYHRYVAFNKVGFAREWNKHQNEDDEDWFGEAQKYEPQANQTTNIIAAYEWALEEAKAHREEFPESTITILNITDGEHNEFDPNPSMTNYRISQERRRLGEQLESGEGVTTMTDIAEEIIQLDLEDSGTVRRCILGYLWYGSPSESFPLLDEFPESPPVKCSRLPGEFIEALRKHSPDIVRQYKLVENNPPMFFMGAMDFTNIADFISIGTSTQGDLSRTSSEESPLWGSEGEFD